MHMARPAQMQPGSFKNSAHFVNITIAAEQSGERELLDFLRVLLVLEL